MRRRPAALAVIAVSVLAACGLSTGTSIAAEHLTATNTLIADALDQIQTATTYHMLISYSAGVQEDFKADLHIRVPDEAIGTVAVNGAAVSVAEAAGELYVQGQDFVSEYAGSRDARLFGDRWIRASPGFLRITVLDLAHLIRLPQAFLGFEVGDTRFDHVPAATESTAEIKSTWGNLYITELAPHRLVKVESNAGFEAMSGFWGVNFELFEFGDPVDVTKPAQFGDLDTPSTLPPDWELTGTPNAPGCTHYSCGFSGKVVNNGGAYPAIGPSTYTFSVYTSPAKRLIDHCSGVIPAAVNGATRGISCTIASQAWRSYAGSSFYWKVVVDNPNYDG